MTTVFRLPEEPPDGTTVRGDDDVKWTRGDGVWYPSKTAYSTRSWKLLLAEFGPLAVVEPDPHPTPWVARYIEAASSHDSYAYIEDATGGTVLTAGPEQHQVDLTRRIVDAVNKAAET